MIRGGRRRGLSLVEILLLVMIGAVVAVAYFAFVRGNTDEVEDLYLRTRAMLAAQQVLEESRLELTRTSLAGFRTRRLELDRMSGSLEVAPYPPRPSLFLAKVTVRWTARPGAPEHRLVLSQLLREADRPPGAPPPGGVTDVTP